MRVTRAIGLFALTLLGCGGDASPVPEPGLFIAMGEQFRDFRSWPRVAISADADVPDPDQPFFAYANQSPPAAGGEYPVGTLIVHTIELTDDPMTWEVFAMAKRGGGYNAEGAHGWEYFRLGFGHGDVPVIVSRGFAPTDSGSYSAGMGAGTGCNACHATAAAAETDFILSRQLRPGAGRR